MPMGADTLTRMNVTYVYKGVNCVNSFWARSKPGDPLGTMQAHCDKMIFDFEALILPRLKSCLVTGAQIIGAVATMLNPLGAAQSIKSWTTEFGTFAGEGLPPHDAAVLSLYTGFPGRRVHGRLYIGAVPETAQEGGELNDNMVANLKNLGDNLIVNFGDTGSSPNYWWGVYSRANGRHRQPGPPPYFTYDTDALIPWKRHVPNKRIGTQRHRKLGRGM